MALIRKVSVFHKHVEYVKLIKIEKYTSNFEVNFLKFQYSESSSYILEKVATVQHSVKARNPDNFITIRRLKINVSSHIESLDHFGLCESSILILNLAPSFTTVNKMPSDSPWFFDRLKHKALLSK